MHIESEVVAITAIANAAIVPRTALITTLLECSSLVHFLSVDRFVGELVSAAFSMKEVFILGVLVDF